MTQEEKDLLLKDLCARLPYGVIVDYKESEFETPHWRITTIYPASLDGWIGYDERVGVGSKSGSRPFEVGQYKPYLRPMSSMTEDEKIEWDAEYAYNSKSYEYEEYLSKMIDWLNAHHFDYRGLIRKGLAIEVTDENNPYKET